MSGMRKATKLPMFKAVDVDREEFSKALKERLSDRRAVSSGDGTQPPTAEGDELTR